MASGVGQDAGTYLNAAYRFGQKPSVVTSYNVVWPVIGKAGPDYLNINSPQYVWYSSTHTTDSASSTGMRKVAIQGISASLTLQAEEIWLNGTSPVTSSLIYTRVFRSWGTRCGSNGTNAGSMFCGYGAVTAGVPASILTKIDVGAGQTEQLTFTGPVSVTGHVHNVNWHIGKDGGGQAVLGTFQMRTRQIIGTHGSYELGPWRERFIGATTDDIDFSTDGDAIVFYGPFDFEVRVLGSATGARASVSVGGEFHRQIQVPEII